MIKTVLLMLMLAALPAPASAQLAPAMPKWDADATLGFLFSSSKDIWQSPYSFGNAAAVSGLDLGRFWSAHLKTDVGLLLAPDKTLYSTVPFAVSGSQQSGYAFSQRTVQLRAISGAVTYQFFENAFAHPYVSGGVRFASLDEHRVVQRTISSGRGGSLSESTVPLETSENDTSLLARPFTAVGCKSYFNRRAFVRSELLTAVGPAGYSHMTIRAGIGVDF